MILECKSGALSWVALRMRGSLRREGVGGGRRLSVHGRHSYRLPRSWLMFSARIPTALRCPEARPNDRGVHHLDRISLDRISRHCRASGRCIAVGAAIGTPMGGGGDDDSGRLALQRVSLGAVFVPVLVAVVASLLFSAVYRRDITCPRLRRLRLARKTGTLGVRHYTVVSHDGGWLIVERDDGEQRPGRARAFSIRGESGALFPGGVTAPKPFARRSPASGGNPRTRCQYTRYEP